MTVADTERALVEELMILPDPQERLAHLMRRAARRPPWSTSQRSDSDLVPGCVSRVWLVGTLENDRCHFQVAADSPMVHGLMGRGSTWYTTHAKKRAKSGTKSARSAEQPSFAL